MAFLTVRDAAGRRVHPLDAEAVIGRGTSCAVLLNDPEASKKHAEVQERGGRFLLRDLGSTNGVLMSGKRLEREVSLQDGDEFTIGSSRLIFTRNAPPGALPEKDTAPPGAQEQLSDEEGTVPAKKGVHEVPARGTRKVPRGTVVVPLERFTLGALGAAGAPSAEEAPVTESAQAATGGAMGRDVGLWMRSLYQLLREANGCETEDELFGTTTRMLGEALPGSRVRILFEAADGKAARDRKKEDGEDGADLRLQAWSPGPRRTGKTTAILAERLAGQRSALLTYARERGVAVLSADVEADARGSARKGRTTHVVRREATEHEAAAQRLSLLIAPLLAGSAALGYLVVERTYRPAGERGRGAPGTAGSSGGPFTAEHLDFLAAAAYPLATLLANLRRRQTVLRQNERLRQSVSDRYTIVGEAPAFQAVLQILPRVAQSNAPVLILGESGTGKELAARAIHALSPRREGPFEALNCAALPEHLIESELFGHAKGAFTGATVDRAGYFETASGGTLLLDEIGELPAAAQAKLLRVLEDSRIARVGESRLREIDCRVLAATNRDLAAEVEAGRFRTDLYYRLRVMDVTLPPLRERLEDLPLLCTHLLAPFGAFELEPAVLELLRRYAWPGNIRELRNALERMAVLSRPGGPRGETVVLKPDDVPLDIRRAVEGGAVPRPASSARHSGATRLLPPAPPEASAFTVQPTAMAPLEKLQVEYARWVLRQVGGNKTKAARILGIQRSTLYAWTEWNT